MDVEIKVLKFTNSTCTIEFSMIDLFPIPNFSEIEDCLLYPTNLGLKGQIY